MGIALSRSFTFRRRTAIGALLACGIAGALGAEERRAPRILFVCQYGAVKSPIARELLRRRARERNVALRTFSRGITPRAYLPAAMEARLRADGIDTQREGLHRLLPIDASGADVVIYFNPLPAGFEAASSFDWTGVPSVLESYPFALADLNRRIDILLDSLAR